MILVILLILLIFGGFVDFGGFGDFQGLTSTKRLAHGNVVKESFKVAIL